MTEQDITQIESRLGIRVPVAYRDFMISDWAEGAPFLFASSSDVILANEAARIACWLGRPLPRSFFIFGVDEKSRALFLDLDFPELPVLVADELGRRGAVKAQSFHDWIRRGDANVA
jgi:hypothetical protein